VISFGEDPAHSTHRDTSVCCGAEVAARFYYGVPGALAIYTDPNTRPLVVSPQLSDYYWLSSNIAAVDALMIDYQPADVAWMCASPTEFRRARSRSSTRCNTRRVGGGGGDEPDLTAAKPLEPAAQARIQTAKQLSNAPFTWWCRGVATEHVNDVWCRALASLLDVIGSDTSIIARRQFGGPRRVGRCSENVVHLVSVRQWMQVRRGCSAHC
jgi:hypothetical protein